MKSLFRAFLVATFAGVVFSGCSGSPEKSAPSVTAHYDLLIGGYTEGPASSGLRQGVEVYRFDMASGDLRFLRENAGIRNPSWLLAMPSGKHIFTVNELNDGKGAGRVSSFAFDATTGEMTFVNDVPSGGDDPCHLAFGGVEFGYRISYEDMEKSIRETGAIPPPEASGGHGFYGGPLYVSNYSSGGVRMLNTDAGSEVPGTLFVSGPAWGALASIPAGPGSHTHAVVSIGEGVVVADLGTDRLLLRFSNGAAKHEDSDLRFPAGTGPRHLVFDKSGKRAYLVGELNDTVTQLDYRNEKLSVVKTYPLGETPAFKKGTAGAIRLSDDGRFLYATTRNPKNKIHVFAVAPDSGELTPVQTIPSGGKGPRDIVLSPDGRFLLAANQGSDTVTVFGRDPASGRLHGPVKTLRSGSPSALIWVVAPGGGFGEIQKQD